MAGCRSACSQPGSGENTKSVSLQLASRNTLAQTQSAMACESKAFLSIPPVRDLHIATAPLKTGGQSKTSFKQHDLTLEKQHLGKSVPAHIHYIKTTTARLSFP